MKLSLPAQPILLTSPVLIIGTYGSDARPTIMNAAYYNIGCKLGGAFTAGKELQRS
jgi:hypothetical protein